MEKLIYREAQVSQPNKTDRTVEVAFATETPANMRDDNYEPIIEVLGVTAEEIDTSWISTGRAPFLLEHWQDDQIGVIQSISIGDDHVARAVIKFSQVGKGAEVYQDVLDGVRKNISVGYIRQEQQLVGNQDGVPVFRTTRWKPMEISIVSIPADKEAYIGRSENDIGGTINKDNETNSVEEVLAAGAANQGTLVAEPEANNDVEVVQEAERHNSTPIIEVTKMDVKIDREAEMTRIRELIDLGDKYNARKDAMEFVNSEKSVEAFRAHLFEKQATSAPIKNSFDMDKELSTDERKAYNVANVIRAAMTGNQDSVGLEREVSNEIAKRTGRSAKDDKNFFVPEYAVRTQSVGIAANQGSDLVRPEYQGHIDPAYQESVLGKLGVTYLPGLTGNPEWSKNGLLTFYWVDEGVAVTESTMSTGTVGMLPKTVGALVNVTRRLMLQSNPSIDALLVRNFYAGLLAEIGSAIINGTGANGKPTGILSTAGMAGVTFGGAPTWAKILEFRKQVAAAKITNQDAYKYLTNSAVEVALMSTVKAGTQVFIKGEDDTLAGKPFVATDAVPANYGTEPDNDKSAMVYGDFSNVIFGTWSDIEIGRTDSDGTKFAAGTSSVRALQDVGCVVLRPETFVFANDIVA